MFSFIFSKFWFSGLLGGKKAKAAQNDKKLSWSCSISQEPYILWLFMVHMCKMIIYPGVWFSFFQISICCVGRRGDGKKQSKMTKNTVHPTPYLRNYIYIIWSSFMVHIRKRIISPSIFFISKYLFLWSLGSLNSKKWSKMTKNCQELYIIGYCDFLYTCVKWWYIIFLKFWIFGF